MKNREEIPYLDQAALMPVIVRNQGITMGKRCNELPPAEKILVRACIS